MRNNPVVDKWKQKVWDSIEYNVVEENGKLTLVQTHKRELKPVDIMEDYSFSKVALEQLEQKRQEVAAMPEKNQEFLQNEHPKLLASCDNDIKAFEKLHEQLEALSTQYEDVKAKGRDFIAEYKQTNDYENKDRYGKVEVREKALMAVADELEIVAEHPIVSELRRECFE